MKSAPSTDWERLLLAYLHDPPDKALDIRGHERRAARYASAALGREVTEAEIRGEASVADPVAAVAERLPFPSAGRHGERAVGVSDGLLVRHPLSAEAHELTSLKLQEEAIERVIRHIVNEIPAHRVSPRTRFLALWRLLPERLANHDASMSLLPADTRVPDHSLTAHADITAGLWAALQGREGHAVLSFSVGPVQSFIEASRSVRDLWSGSAILSWLIFRAMCPVIDGFGPTALVFPALRTNPLMDRWLRQEIGGDLIPDPDEVARRSPSLPNRFVAVVPSGPGRDTAGSVAASCEGAAHDAWKELHASVRDRCARELADIDPEWDRRWDGQAQSFFDVQATVVPARQLGEERMTRLFGGREFGDLWPDAAKIRRLASAIPQAERPRYAQDRAGNWQATLELSVRIMEANRMVRHAPGDEPAGPGAQVPAKCSLFGSFEQMGPDDWSASARFWNGATQRLRIGRTRLRGRERFCAVALAKRFAAPAFLAKEFGLPKEQWFPDTATVAAASWLREAGMDPATISAWNGQWLHGSGDERPPDGLAERIRGARRQAKCPPPAYYAVLKMDGDDIGAWLRGAKSPRVRDVLHPKLVKYFEGLRDPEVQDALDARRPVGPALHASISAALGKFAFRVAPRIIGEHHGVVVYSGGDDLLALLPAVEAVRCATKLRQAYREHKEPGQPPAMGSRATISAGIAFVHYKEDLRQALRAARRNEQRAKELGKDRLALEFRRRSGEHAHSMLRWDQTDSFCELTGRFRGGATDRWAYRLRSEAPTLRPPLPHAAIESEIRRLAARIQDPKWGGTAEERAETVDRFWQDLRVGEERDDPAEAFAVLCQGASFIARGSDR